MPSFPEDGRPYAYRTGEVEFFLLPFRSDERALVPRFETESLVRAAIAEIAEGGYSTIVDVGTGSGVIAVSLAKRFPNLRTVALDRSVRALSLARENANLNAVSVEFVESDLLSDLPDLADWGVCFVANLPYVRDGDRENMSPDTAFEPPEALYGGSKTGFELTERFLWEAERFRILHPERKIAVLCEVGHDHAGEIARFARQSGREVRTFPDLSGVHRFFAYRIWPK